MAAWSDYQETVAEFFRGLGLDAETNVRRRGVRTTHDIDVFVTSTHAGMTVTWIVECKRWKSRVSKDKVFALRAIVDDLGADRGILMSESGYQSGALEAARSTNTMLTSLADLTETLSHELGLARLRKLLVRIEACRDRYWDLSKSDRIEHGLRPDSMASGYSGDTVIIAVRETLLSAFLNGFPVRYDRVLTAVYARSGMLLEMGHSDSAKLFHTPDELLQVLEKEVSQLEALLDGAELATRDDRLRLPPRAPVRDE